MYDEVIGHIMWYTPLFAALMVYFSGSFAAADRASHLPLAARFVLSPLTALYMWYLVTEGQISELFALSLLAMLAMVAYQWQRGRKPNANGQFMLEFFALTALLCVVWVAYLWSDSALRERYPHWWYVPEPWSYWTLYHGAAH